MWIDIDWDNLKIVITSDIAYNASSRLTLLQKRLNLVDFFSQIGYILKRTRNSGNTTKRADKLSSYEIEALCSKIIVGPPHNSY